MKITVNGEERTVEEGATIRSLVESLGLTAGRLATELNGDIVPRAQYAHRTLNEGDVLEIVQMIGGG